MDWYRGYLIVLKAPSRVIMPINDVTRRSIWTIRNNKDELILHHNRLLMYNLTAFFPLKCCFHDEENNVPTCSDFRQGNLSTPGKKWCLLLKPLSECVAEVSEFFRCSNVTS